jgi:hypothetical protein
VYQANQAINEIVVINEKLSQNLSCELPMLFADNTPFVRLFMFKIVAISIFKYGDEQFNEYYWIMNGSYLIIKIREMCSLTNST